MAAGTGREEQAVEIERELGEKWWRVAEAVPAEDGTRMWTVELAQCVGFYMGDPDTEAADYANLYTASTKVAASLARKLNKRDNLKGTK